MRWLWLFLLLLLPTGCVTTRAECTRACGAGHLCEKVDAPYSPEPIYACYLECHSDAQCPAPQRCNCEGDACSLHSTQVMLNICVKPPELPNDPFYEHFGREKGEQRFCDKCPPGQLCLDVGNGDKPEFQCLLRCTSDSECKSPARCNCSMEAGSYCLDDYPHNICLTPKAVPPTEPSPTSPR